MTEQTHHQHGKPYVIEEDFNIELPRHTTKNQKSSIKGIRLCNLAIYGTKNIKKVTVCGMYFLWIKRNNYVEHNDNSEIEKSYVAQLKDDDLP